MTTATSTKEGDCATMRRHYLFALWSFGEPQRAAKFVSTRRPGSPRLIRQETLERPPLLSAEQIAERVMAVLDLSSLRAQQHTLLVRLFTALACQSRAVRDIVLMAKVLDFTHAERATALGLTPTRAEALLATGLERLRSAFARVSSTRATDQLDTGYAAMPSTVAGDAFESAIAAMRALVQRYIHAPDVTEDVNRAWRRRFKLALSLLGLVMWFLVPVAVIAGVSELLIALELRSNTASVVEL